MLHDLVYSILGQAIVLAAHLKLISFRIVLVRYVAAELIGAIEGSSWVQVSPLKDIVLKPRHELYLSIYFVSY